MFKNDERYWDINLLNKWFAISSLVFLAVIVWMFIDDNDDEFKEYAFTILQKAFGADFDEAKAQEVVDGILGKVDGDYGKAAGILQSSLG